MLDTSEFILSKKILPTFKIVQKQQAVFRRPLLYSYLMQEFLDIIDLKNSNIQDIFCCFPLIQNEKRKRIKYANPLHIRSGLNLSYI